MYGGNKKGLELKMTINEMVIDAVNSFVQICGPECTMSRREIYYMISEKYDIKYSSFLPQDYCYNRTNMGIKYNEHAHLFEYVEKDWYRLLGENFPYTGPIMHKPAGFVEIEVGMWENGQAEFYDDRYNN